MNRIAAAAAALLAFVASLLVAAPAHASCAGPVITVAPTRVVPSSIVTVTGKYFTATCNDGSAGDEPEKKANPAHVSITFTQGGRVATLATVTATREYTIDETVRIPTWAAPGEATIDAGEALPARLRILAPSAATSELADTGPATNVGLLALAGLTLVCVGALLASRTRTRRAGH